GRHTRFSRDWSSDVCSSDLADGYLWAGERKLRVPTEADFFALCGLGYVEPQDRSEDLYRRAHRLPAFRWGDPTGYIIPTPAARQTSLFADPAGDVRAGAADWSQAELDAMFQEQWRGRAAVFVARLDAELAFARARYSRAQRAEQKARHELDEQLMRDEASGASKSAMEKHRAEYASALSDARYDMRQALERAGWLRACRFVIWLGEMVSVVYEAGQREMA